MSIRNARLKDHSISVDQARYGTSIVVSIYYKYTPDESKIVVLSYVDDYFYWYTNEDIGKWFVDTLGKIPCELLRVCTLIYVNKHFSVEGSFHFCGPG